MRAEFVVSTSMSAKTALELACPIRDVLAFASTSTDKAGGSIPAPGLSTLIVARQVSSNHPSRFSASLTARANSRTAASSSHSG
uniref:Uncharacterized protein n=1 Tax=Mycena chlorophos TaxID=658473 RepID=A0ABQ0LMK8_MYCCL|nr:predicted protein [Mycena chlorophos]